MNQSSGHFVSRRQFITAGIGASIFLTGAPRGLANVPTQSIDARRRALGSSVRIQVLTTDRSSGQKAIEAAFAAIEQVENSMSLYREGSEVARLNRKRTLTSPSSKLLHVLRLAQEIAERSDGAFDPTVQPLWELYRNAQRRNRIPSNDQVHNVRKSIDFRRIRISQDQVQLDAPLKSITLNGIAQGFATDVAKATLKEHGIQHALVDCGELALLGRNQSNTKWKVGIQHPRDKQAFATLSQIENRCLATSGDYETAFTENFAQHHIFDPRTGQSPTELASASVVAPSAALADALSTTILVLGIKKGLRLIAEFEETDALLLTKDGRQVSTPEFPFTS